MRVKVKLILLVLALVLIVSTRLFFARKDQEEGLRAVLEDQQARASESLAQMVDLEGRTLALLVHDYTHWDAMAEYAASGKDSQMEDVLSSALTSYNIDAVWVYKPDFTRVYFSGRADVDLGQADFLTQEMLRAAFQASRTAHFFICPSAGELWEVRASSIHTTLDINRVMDPSGYFIAARRWDKAYLDRISTLSGGTVAIVSASNPFGEIGPGSITASFPFSGWDGQPLDVSLQVKIPHPVSSALVHMRDRDMITYTGASLLALFVLMTALYHWVWGPLNKVSLSLENRTIEPIRRYLGRRDEFGALSSLIDRSFQQQAELDAENSRRLEYEKALRSSEEAYRQEQAFVLTVLNTINTIVVIFDRNGVVVRCNPAFERALNRSFHELAGKPFWENMQNSQEGQAMKALFLDTLEKGQCIQREVSFRLSTGGRWWLSFANAFLFDEEGNVSHLIITGLDVTERKLREHQQESIAVLASDLRGYLSRDQAVQVVLERTMDFMRCDVAALGFIREESGQVVIERALGTSSEELIGLALPADRLLLQRDTMDRGSAPESAANLFAVLPRAVGSLACEPMQMEGSPLGVLLVARSELLAETELRLLSAFADIAASAIHRCVLSDDAQRRIHRLSALHTINIAVSASLDIRVTLRVLVNQITSQLGVDAADIYLVDPITREMRFAAGHGFLKHEGEKPRLWLGQGISGRVAMERRGIRMYDPRGIAGSFLPERDLREEGFIAFEAVPLTIKGEVRGVLETFHRAPYQPDSEWLPYLDALAVETAIAINNAELLERLQRSNQDLSLAYDATIEGWALAQEMSDRIAEGHTRRVSEITVRLAQALQVRGDDLVHIRRGALLHDIGKMGISVTILNKPGPLTPEEQVLVRTHPRLAYQMLSSIPFLRPALAIPYYHHERWDGSGYPDGLTGKEIPLAARIFAVVDVWDELHYGRIYTPPMPEADILAYLQQQAGRLFDPDVVAAFIDIRRYSSQND